MNIVLVVTTYSQILKTVVFKEKELQKNKSLAKWQEEKFQQSFETTILTI